MKAVMDETGLITISAETGAEAFALKNWVQKNYTSGFVEYRVGEEKTQGMYRGNNLIIVSAVVKDVE